MTLETILGLQNQVSWAQECARALLVFIYGVLVIRLAGRRIFGKWAALDIVVAIVAGSNLSRVLTGNAPLFGTLAATTVLVAAHWVAARASAKSRFMSRLLEGRGIELGREGEIDEAELVRQGVTPADLQEALRQSGLQSATGVRLIVLEPSGKINVLK